MDKGRGLASVMVLSTTVSSGSGWGLISTWFWNGPWDTGWSGHAD